MKSVLILLIGGNPLPNYVVLDYLLNDDRKDKEKMPVPKVAALLHSVETKQFAETLEREFRDKVDIKLLDLKQEERNCEMIKNVLAKFISSIENLRSLHLNYTGGTKPMAVHSYNVVSQHNTSAQKIFSDLDPEKSKIRIDESEELFPTDSDLTAKITLTVEKLFGIHNQQVTKKGDEKTTYDQSLVDIEKFALDALNKMKQERRRLGWVNKLSENFKEIKKKENKLREKLQTFDFGPFDENGIKYDSFPLEYPSLSRFFEGDRFKLDNQESNPLRKFIEFFDGVWLEDYIFHVLDSLIKEKHLRKITDLRKSVESKVNNRGPEIDVIVIKGFRPFYITCTTDCSIGRVKEKAFEALYRGEQIGGEHVAVIVVSPMPCEDIKGFDNTQSNLRNDLSEFRAARKCSLIGYEDLFDKKRLEEKLVRIIEKGEVL